MITITVKAKTENAYKGLKRHFKECNTWKNKLTLKAHGVTQRLRPFNSTLTICYANLLLKLQDKIKTDFKAILKEDQKQDFIKQVDNFMGVQLIEKKEYEVLFDSE